MAKAASIAGCAGRWRWGSRRAAARSARSRAVAQPRTNSATATPPLSPAPRSRTETRALGRLALADDEHVGDLAQLGVADLAPDRLGAVVELAAQAGRRQRSRTARGRLVLAVGDRQDDRLDRREPSRQLAAEVLEQDRR